MTVPKGFLPVTSVGSEEEAKALLISGCSFDSKLGEFFSQELNQEQTLERLYSFGKKLEAIHDQYFKGTKQCHCKEGK